MNQQNQRASSEVKREYFHSARIIFLAIDCDPLKCVYIWDFLCCIIIYPPNWAQSIDLGAGALFILPGTVWPE